MPLQQPVSCKTVEQHRSALALKLCWKRQDLQNSDLLH